MFRKVFQSWEDQSELQCYLMLCTLFDELRSLFPFGFLCVYFTKISLDLNGFFRVQAMREVELQITTSYKKETCFSHFQISAIAVSAIEGHSYFSALSFLFILSK